MTSDTRELVRDALADALQSAQQDGALPSVPAPEIRVQRSQSPEHGDYACNLAMRLAGAMRMPPLEVAETIVARVERGDLLAAAEAAGAAPLREWMPVDRQRSVWRAARQGRPFRFQSARLRQCVRCRARGWQRPPDGL